MRRLPGGSGKRQLALDPVFSLRFCSDADLAERVEDPVVKEVLGALGQPTKFGSLRLHELLVHPGRPLVHAQLLLELHAAQAAHAAGVVKGLSPLSPTEHRVAFKEPDLKMIDATYKMAGHVGSWH